MSSSEKSHHSLKQIFGDQQQTIRLPKDQAAYSDLLLAAARPDDDFPSFIWATAALLMDRLLCGDGPDNLYWNWDAFKDHYRLADAPMRAALMNGFRLADEIELISIDDGPCERDCLTVSADEILYGGAKYNGLKRLIIGDVSARDAGMSWIQSSGIDGNASLGFRYLYERPASIHPVPAHKAPLIPWLPMSGNCPRR